MGVFARILSNLVADDEPPDCLPRHHPSSVKPLTFPVEHAAVGRAELVGSPRTESGKEQIPIGVAGQGIEPADFLAREPAERSVLVVADRGLSSRPRPDREDAVLNAIFEAMPRYLARLDRGHAELFVEFTRQGLRPSLSDLDVPAEQIPAVGATHLPGASPSKQKAILAHEQSADEADRLSHCGGTV
jgi:hypothetical protein